MTSANPFPSINLSLSIVRGPATSSQTELVLLALQAYQRELLCTAEKNLHDPAYHAELLREMDHVADLISQVHIEIFAVISQLAASQGILPVCHEQQ